VIQEYSLLVELERNHEAQLLSPYGALRTAGEGHFLADWEPAQGNIAAYVKRLKTFSQGIGLAEGVVPESTYWLVRDGTTFVGFSRLRHRLVPALEHHGGHVGYAIHPSERRKGHGTRILALTLDKAREMGLDRLLVTCDTDNVASVRVIEKNGGRHQYRLRRLALRSWRTARRELLGCATTCRGL
jgi:predicted acetyltransferase